MIDQALEGRTRHRIAEAFAVELAFELKDGGVGHAFAASLPGRGRCSHKRLSLRLKGMPGFAEPIVQERRVKVHLHDAVVGRDSA